ncbi:MAG: DNA-processing protein DprA [Marinosulfonomonas sp.]
MEELAAWFRLLRSRRVGPTTFYRLMQEHGSIDAALAALPEIAKAAGVKDYELCSPSAVQAELNAGRIAGATPIPFGSVDYPEKLAELPDAPPILWALGNPELLKKPMVALVGARNASSLGTRMARQLANGLAEAGLIVVSGLARGIDAAAHVAAKDSGTLAVMAGGVDVVYPAENAVLAQEILDHGLRLSEQPMGLQPIARHFPQRNRIISGISQAVVVVEAAARSGSLITAKNALDQGRDVLVVPGHPFDARASGCNMLIRDGAQLVRNVDDIIESLAPIGEEDPTKAGAQPAPKSKHPAIEQAKLHSEILNRLGPSPVAEDQLIRDLNVPAAKIAPELVSLELQGVIIRQSGGLLSKSPSA